ncbi:MAG: ribosomal protein S18-alanine N-acetyltransferase [Sphingomonadaceae bacterium]
MTVRDAPEPLLAPPGGDPLAGVTVRPGAAADLPGAEALMAEAFDSRFGEAWRAGQIAQTMAAPGGRLLVMVRGEAQLLGFSLTRIIAGEAELLLLAIAPQARRAGLGDWLLASAMTDAQRRGAAEMFLEVREDNHAARRLYASRGFVEVGQRPGYYRGEGLRRHHAVSMRRRLDA